MTLNTVCVFSRFERAWTSRALRASWRWKTTSTMPSGWWPPLRFGRSFRLLTKMRAPKVNYVAQRELQASHAWARKRLYCQCCFRFFFQEKLDQTEDKLASAEADIARLQMDLARVTAAEHSVRKELSDANSQHAELEAALRNTVKLRLCGSTITEATGS